jgi:hypothetical protein
MIFKDRVTRSRFTVPVVSSTKHGLPFANESLLDGAAVEYLMAIKGMHA